MRDTHLNFQNILVIDFGQLGDVVLSLPALKAIRQKFPDSHIAVIAGKIPSEVIRLSGLADEVIPVDRVKLRDGPKLRSLGAVFRFVGEIRRRPTDLVIDLHSLSETNILAFLSKAKYRLLANRESRSLDILSNFRPRPPKEDKTKHLSERYADVLRPLGISGLNGELRVHASPADIEHVEAKFFTDPNRRYVGLFPGAGHPSRCWNLKNFVALVAKLDADGLRSAVFLGPEEEAMRSRVAASFPGTTIIIDGLSIPQFIAAAAHVDTFVTNDTGPMHLAACVGVPVLLLLDERAPTTYLPLTKKLEIVRNQTIDQISVEDVYGAVNSLLAKHEPRSNDKSDVP